ncbi:MAG: Nif11 domain/cupin domain-containing protein [Synechococcus sp.]|nr:Nif11 domain/cupin domain-containing protein [Synechococcus sp.]
MAETDLQRFLDKVQQLKALETLLEQDEDRRKAFAACDDHNQVVQLARLWGFEIGRRWGEQPVDPLAPIPRSLGGQQPPAFLAVDPLLRSPLPSSGLERVRELQRGVGWRLDLIHSCEASSPPGFWYDQREHEWLTLLRGSARLQFKDPDQAMDLSVGDGLYLPPHRHHRVERTDPDPGTIWLALYWWEV